MDSIFGGSSSSCAGMWWHDHKNWLLQDIMWHRMRGTCQVLWSHRRDKNSKKLLLSHFWHTVLHKSSAEPHLLRSNRRSDSSILWSHVKEWILSSQKTAWISASQLHQVTCWGTGCETRKEKGVERLFFFSSEGTRLCWWLRLVRSAGVEPHASLQNTLPITRRSDGLMHVARHLNLAAERWSSDGGEAERECGTNELLLLSGGDVSSAATFMSSLLLVVLSLTQPSGL